MLSYLRYYCKPLAELFPHRSIAPATASYITMMAHASGKLRTIAASCKSKSVAKLFYNRAYHADLVSEATTLPGLIAYSNNNSSVHFEAYRLYMAFLEQMAKIWYPDSAARASFLNREYDRRVEIEGLRLRGYDHVADYLERSFITPWQINGSGRIKGNRLGD